MLTSFVGGLKVYGRSSFVGPGDCIQAIHSTIELLPSPEVLNLGSMTGFWGLKLYACICTCTHITTHTHISFCVCVQNCGLNADPHCC
jgi:hypothetical protein